uniref:subtilisin-like protease SBT3.4 n=1 Tax=Erigeron canadensis TaxID=72917 RepID=UPI001CB89566|nr:subtilisin-like protease SBT3.4 [Erigeron canadensis]
MAAEQPNSPLPKPTEPAAEIHIIYTDQIQPPRDPETHHLRTLTSVLGSEDAAEEALLYTYKHAASGFSAKLTPAQVEAISKKPGVLQVVKSSTAQLHSGPPSTRNL